MKLSYTRYDYGNLTAKYLLEIGAVEFRPDNPFKFTSGRLSPVYVDVRRILGHPAARANIAAMACQQIRAKFSTPSFGIVAGGETAGIPIATLIGDRLDKPVVYVRKTPKDFGRGAQIEGLSDEELSAGRHVLLCEDLMSDGGSKRNFIDAIRRSGNIVSAVFVVFSYGCFGAEDWLLAEGIQMCSLCDAKLLADIAEDLEIYPAETIAGVRSFIANPDEFGKDRTDDGTA